MHTTAKDLANFPMSGKTVKSLAEIVIPLSEPKGRTASEIIVDSMVASACRMISEVCAKVDAMTPEELKAFDIRGKGGGGRSGLRRPPLREERMLRRSHIVFKLIHHNRARD